MKKCATILGVLALAASAQAQIEITEYMYDSSTTGINVEFIEIKNVSGGPVNMTGWSFDDNSATSGSFSLGGLGTLAANEVAIITEQSANAFRFSWGLPSTVKVAAGNTHNIGRNDEIYIFDSSGNVVDWLAYGDQDYPGSVRAHGVSGTVDPLDLGDNFTSPNWFLSTFDPSAWVSSNGDVGSPGIYP